MTNSVKNQRFQAGTLGPGPAAYTLPTSVGYQFEGKPLKKIDRHIPKMYSFGVRPHTGYSTLGPGPIPNTPPAKKGEYEPIMTRHGKTASYKYTFGHRTHLIGMSVFF